MLVREATTIEDMAATCAVFDAVWRGNVPPANLVRAIAHAGGYVSVAEDAGAIVGGSVGFLGRTGDGEIILHSHITATLPGGHDRGTGFALKQHQRAWCLDRGIATVVWTFDPLVRRNAYFNLTKLGAEVTTYHPDFYGPMPDAVNEGDETDRIVATWRLSSDRAVAAAEKRLAPTADGEVVLDIDDADRPAHHEPEAAGNRLVRVPEDIAALRQRDPALGRRWRRAVRDVLGGALSRGYVATAMTRDGYYLLERT